MTDRHEQKEQSRARILASAGRGFRALGYGGLGVDGLAKEAGATSGAFYAHFKSKSAAFREAVAAGMRDLQAGVKTLRTQHGAGWRRAFVDFYMGERRTADISDSCALQSLTGDVARADQATREDYERALKLVIEATADGLDAASPADRRADAIALLALLSGGVSLARAVNDPKFAKEIADAVRRAALLLEGDQATPSQDKPSRKPK